MLKMYDDVAVCYIAYGDEVTSIFKTKTGVKQGGPLSPKLYNAYIADIVVKINEVQDGVFIGDIKLNIIIYADDILLLSNTKVGMVKMLNKLKVYMVMWKIVINWDKTNYLVVGETKLLISPVLVEGIEVKRVKEIKYLGFHINEEFESLQHLQIKSKALMRRSYSLYNIGFLSIGLKVETKSFVYETYCRPTVTYGLDLLDLDEKVLKSLRTDEGILLKRILVVPKRSQTTPYLQIVEN
jgi:hypothetical protein